MLVAPAFWPVTRPVLLTVATVVLSLLHAAPEEVTSTRLPSLYTASAFNWTCAPLSTVADAGETSTRSTAFLLIV